MYCLDSNIIIDFWRGDLAIRKKFSSISSGSFFITSITLCELYQGAYISKDVDIGLQAIQALLDIVSFVEFDTKSCDFFGKEFARLSKLGKKPQEPDLMIASIAKINNFTVVTRDKKGFKNIDVDVEEW